MGLLLTWGELLQGDDGKTRGLSRPVRREGNVVYLLKEDEPPLPFSPENDKLAVLLARIVAFVTEERKARRALLDDHISEQSTEPKNRPE